MTVSAFAEITQAHLLPRIVRLGENLYGAVFVLMKLVPARHILLKAHDRGAIDPDTVIVETTSGTFGLALAMQSALMRRRFIAVSDPVIDANLHRRLTDLGTRVEICDRPLAVGGYQEARLQRLAQLRAEFPNSFCPEQYSNPDNPASYAIVAEHLERTLGTVDCVIGPVGSGGSMCGTVRALRSARDDVRAVAVDTHSSMLFGPTDGPRALRGLGNSLMPPNLDHTVFDEVHWSSAAEAYAATRDLHRTHALFQGPTSGAAYGVAKWWAQRHPDARCVVMLPDEGYRYQETVYDDEWLAANHYTGQPVARTPVQVSRPTEPGTGWSWFDWRRRSYLDAVGQAPPVRAADLEPAP
ncbi:MULTISPECIES: PLP-dependent cysteine synthase family protein [Dactylosporangium]|uniref:Cystathionine beta-synthase n=2 Tax=Dactylosporangium TaxID=35753 RepID=A0A9W6NQA2_9ACTN|nr:MULTISPECIES: cysteine synthase family protein [Dactylosporangium]UAB93883.1 cysteine synthase family protein [Dactylosporangium vinaceum]UWZ42303.1 cysteine synthase family protein [Dactylosporangium matsuzakiense]GLL05324.1 cystathionine beta-synthase [Dactylosporangium matsuzakiense]